MQDVPEGSTMPENHVSRRDIVTAIREMGLQEGDKVMVHSSLSSMGYVDSGAVTVVEAFLEVLGSEGILMVPTFTHSGTEYYDPLATPSKNGAVSEAARKYPGAVRSLHPTHAVTAIGPDAEELWYGTIWSGGPWPKTVPWIAWQRKGDGFFS